MADNSVEVGKSQARVADPQAEVRLGARPGLAPAAAEKTEKPAELGVLDQLAGIARRLLPLGDDTTATGTRAGHKAPAGQNPTLTRVEPATIDAAAIARAVTPTFAGALADERTPTGAGVPGEVLEAVQKSFTSDKEQLGALGKRYETQLGIAQRYTQLRGGRPSAVEQLEAETGGRLKSLVGLDRKITITEINPMPVMGGPATLEAKASVAFVIEKNGQLQYYAQGPLGFVRLHRPGAPEAKREPEYTFDESGFTFDLQRRDGRWAVASDGPQGASDREITLLQNRVGARNNLRDFAANSKAQLAAAKAQAPVSPAEFLKQRFDPATIRENAQREVAQLTAQLAGSPANRRELETRLVLAKAVATAPFNEETAKTLLAQRARYDVALANIAKHNPGVDLAGFKLVPAVYVDQNLDAQTSTPPLFYKEENSRSGRRVTIIDLSDGSTYAATGANAATAFQAARESMFTNYAARGWYAMANPYDAKDDTVRATWDWVDSSFDWAETISGGASLASMPLLLSPAAPYAAGVMTVGAVVGLAAEGKRFGDNVAARRDPDAVRMIVAAASTAVAAGSVARTVLKDVPALSSRLTGVALVGTGLGTDVYDVWSLGREATRALQDPSLTAQQQTELLQKLVANGGLTVALAMWGNRELAMSSVNAFKRANASLRLDVSQRRQAKMEARAEQGRATPEQVAAAQVAAIDAARAFTANGGSRVDMRLNVVESQAFEHRLGLASRDVSATAKKTGVSEAEVTAELARARAEGVFADPASGQIFFRRDVWQRMSPDERTAAARHEVTHLALTPVMLAQVAAALPPDAIQRIREAAIAVEKAASPNGQSKLEAAWSKQATPAWILEEAIAMHHGSVGRPNERLATALRPALEHPTLRAAGLDRPPEIDVEALQQGRSLRWTRQGRQEVRADAPIRAQAPSDASAMPDKPHEFPKDPRSLIEHPSSLRGKDYSDYEAAVGTVVGQFNDHLRAVHATGDLAYYEKEVKRLSDLIAKKLPNREKAGDVKTAFSSDLPGTLVRPRGATDEQIRDAFQSGVQAAHAADAPRTKPFREMVTPELAQQWNRAVALGMSPEDAAAIAKQIGAKFDGFKVANLGDVLTKKIAQLEAARVANAAKARDDAALAQARTMETPAGGIGGIAALTDDVAKQQFVLARQRNPALKPTDQLLSREPGLMIPTKDGAGRTTAKPLKDGPSTQAMYEEWYKNATPEQRRASLEHIFASYSGKPLTLDAPTLAGGSVDQLRLRMQTQARTNGSIPVTTRYGLELPTRFTEGLGSDEIAALSRRKPPLDAEGAQLFNTWARTAHDAEINAVLKGIARSVSFHPNGVPLSAADPHGLYIATAPGGLDQVRRDRDVLYATSNVGRQADAQRATAAAADAAVAQAEKTAIAAANRAIEDAGLGDAAKRHLERLLGNAGKTIHRENPGPGVAASVTYPAAGEIAARVSVIASAGLRGQAGMTPDAIKALMTAAAESPRSPAQVRTVIEAAKGTPILTSGRAHADALFAADPSVADAVLRDPAVRAAIADSRDPAVTTAILRWPKSAQTAVAEAQTALALRAAVTPEAFARAAGRDGPAGSLRGEFVDAMERRGMPRAQADELSAKVPGATLLSMSRTPGLWDELGALYARLPRESVALGQGPFSLINTMSRSADAGPAILGRVRLMQGWLAALPDAQRAQRAHFLASKPLDEATLRTTLVQDLMRFANGDGSALRGALSTIGRANLTAADTAALDAALRASLRTPAELNPQLAALRG